MKKIIITLLLCFLAAAGCQEELVAQSDSALLFTSNPRELLVKSPVNWVEKYGDDSESQRIANIVLLIQVLNRQGAAIEQLDKRLIVLEKLSNIADPNEDAK